MSEVISYLQRSNSPTSEEAHKIIDDVLHKFNCKSPEGYIVASGIKSAEPHEIGSGLIEKGVPIVVDIYPRSNVSGYFADMSRTVCIGKAPSKLKKMYDTVLKAQLLAMSMIKPKASCHDIQVAVEELFIKAGYETHGKGKEFKFAEGFVHSVGHGVGLDIHEPPFIRKNSNDMLKEGDIITIEPGLYYKKIGGVRLEDLLLVTSNGFENLTNFPKELEI